MTRARTLKIVTLAGVLLVAVVVAAIWTYGSGERTYYGPHTGILHVGDRVVVGEDVSTPGTSVIPKTSRVVVQADPAWDEDSCDPDRLISVQLSSGERLSVPRHVLHR